jgi:hypothetical protein
MAATYTDPSGAYDQRSHFALGSFVKYKSLRRRILFVLPGAGRVRQAKHPAAWLGARDQISFTVKSQHPDVRFITGVIELALAVRRDRENLPLVAGRDIQRPVGAEFDIPDVFRLGIEKDRFFAAG